MARLEDVIGYGTHAARPAAGSAGSLYYETDTDTLLRDNGATWDALSLAGAASPLTTKGDLFAHGTADARLPVGADGEVLTADSTQTLGVKWAAGGGGGAGALTKIGEVVVGAGGAASVAFSDVPGTYRTLELIGLVRGDAAATDNVYVLMQLNGDAGTNYSDVENLGNGTSVVGQQQYAGSSARVAFMGAAASTPNLPTPLTLLLPVYAGTTFSKAWLGWNMWGRELSSASLQAQNFDGVWNSTAAITSILLFPSSGNFAQGSVVSLYGIS